MTSIIHHDSFDLLADLPALFLPNQFRWFSDDGDLNRHGLLESKDLGRSVFVKAADSRRSSLALLEKSLEELRNSNWAISKGFAVASPVQELESMKITTLSPTFAITFWEFLEAEEYSPDEAYPFILQTVLDLAQHEAEDWMSVWSYSDFVKLVRDHWLLLQRFRFANAAPILELVEACATPEFIELAESRPTVVCHGDPHIGNFLKANGEFRIVDWETLRLQPLEMDAAQILRNYPDKMGSLVKELRIDPELTTALATLRAAFALAHNVGLGNTDNPSATNAILWLTTQLNRRNV